MSTVKQVTSNNTEARKIAILAISLLFAAQTTIQSVQAQGMEAVAGSLSQTSSLGPEQESLLPPEVVPLDSVVAQRMTQAQAQSRAVGMDAMPQAQGQGFVPGMAGQQMQTAQDFRRAAFDSLMGQQNAQPRQGFGQGMPGQNGFMNNQPLDPNALGQSPLMSNNGGNPQLSQSGWMQPGQSPAMVNNGISTNPQSQMLSGSVRQKQYRRDIKRAGLSNAFSALAGFGSGMMLGSMVRNPNSGFGLGMMGLGMTGFGTRNGFRF